MSINRRHSVTWNRIIIKPQLYLVKAHPPHHASNINYCKSVSEQQAKVANCSSPMIQTIVYSIEGGTLVQRCQGYSGTSIPDCSMFLCNRSEQSWSISYTRVSSILSPFVGHGGGGSSYAILKQTNGYMSYITNWDQGIHMWRVRTSSLTNMCDFKQGILLGLD